MTARTGDVIHSVEQLEALPAESVVLTADSVSAQLRGGNGWWTTGGAMRAEARHLGLPATVLHVPGEQVHTGDDVIEQAARIARQALGQDRTYDSDVPEAAVRALADAGLLRQEPPTRDEIAHTIYDALSGQYGDFCTPYDAADAVLALWEGRKR